VSAGDASASNSPLGEGASRTRAAGRSARERPLAGRCRNQRWRSQGRSSSRPAPNRGSR
jgi:hypothetical protein